MKLSFARPLHAVAVVFTLTAALALTASAQTKKPNTTLGYGDGQLLNFTYLQNFDCIDQPNSDKKACCYEFRLQTVCYISDRQYGQGSYGRGESKAIPHAKLLQSP